MGKNNYIPLLLPQSLPPSHPPPLPLTLPPFHPPPSYSFPSPPSFCMALLHVSLCGHHGSHYTQGRSGREAKYTSIMTAATWRPPTIKHRHLQLQPSLPVTLAQHAPLQPAREYTNSPHTLRCMAKRQSTITANPS